MLTTATVLMSLGTESVNVRQTPSDRTDTAPISFAKSFDESSAIAGGGQTQVDDRDSSQKAPGDEMDVSTKELKVPASTFIGTKTKNVSVEGKIPSQQGGTKSPFPVTSATGAALTSAEGTAKLASANVLVHGGRSKKETPVDLDVDVPDSQLLLDSGKSVAQKVPPLQTDEVKIASVDEAAASSTDVVIPDPSNMQSDSERPVLPGQKTVLTAGSDPVVAPATKATKGHIAVVKTEKQKSTTKTEMTAKTAVDAENAIAIMPQTGAAVPVIVALLEAQQSKTSTPPDDNLSSSASKVTGQGAVSARSTNGVRDKRPGEAGKAEADTVKADVPTSSDDATLQRSEADAAKTTSAARASAAMGSDAKLQSTVAMLGDTTPIHAEAISGAAPGGIMGHVVAASPPSRESLSHAANAPSGMASHDGSGAIDSAGQIDAVHRTVLATPTTLEVGVANGTHGWLKIRAEMTGGGVVNASLSTASTSGQEMLHRELPSLSAYLQSERVAVNMVVIQPTVAAGIDPRVLAGAMNGDGRGQAQQESGQGGGNPQNAANSVVNRVEAEVQRSSVSRAGGDELPLASYAGGGSWLSVRA